MRPDPAGVFKSDEHRRVLANVAEPRTLDELARAVYTDPNTDLWEQNPGDHSHVLDVLDELRDEGLVKQPDAQGRYEISKAGLDRIQADPENVPAAMDPERALQLHEDFIAAERAKIDQVRSEQQAHLKEVYEQGLADLEDSLSNYEAELEKLRTEGVPSGEES